MYSWQSSSRPGHCEIFFQSLSVVLSRGGKSALSIKAYTEPLEDAVKRLTGHSAYQSLRCWVTSLQRAKKRWVKVAMKVISINRPITASNAARIAIGSSRLNPEGNSPRPWKLLTLKPIASYQASGDEWEG